MRKMPAASGVERSNTSADPSGVALGGPLSESTASAGGCVICRTPVPSAFITKSAPWLCASSRKRRKTIFPCSSELGVVLAAAALSAFV
jgi:hypothetical protein